MNVLLEAFGMIIVMMGTSFLVYVALYLLALALQPVEENLNMAIWAMRDSAAAKKKRSKTHTWVNRAQAAA